MHSHSCKMNYKEKSWCKLAGCQKKGLKYHEDVQHTGGKLKLRRYIKKPTLLVLSDTHNNLYMFFFHAKL